MPLPLSVLDLCPVATNGLPSRAIHESVALARRADELDYTRYWVAEHHNMPAIATSSPEVLIGHLAGVTKRIRVGAGGVMLPNHTPLKVVEIFRTLEALYPGRIDLGVGRAPGTDPVTSSALRRGRVDVDELLADLMAFARDGFPAGHPFASILAMPSDVPLPPMWMLGSTQEGARIAAARGLRYAFAGHFAMRHARAALALYNGQFRASDELPEPYAILALAAVCGEDDAHARRLAAPARLSFVRLAAGERAPLATVEEAAARRLTTEEEALADRVLGGAVVGGPERVGDEIRRLADDLGAHEVMISTMVPDAAERTRSYERIAKRLL